MLGRNKKQAPSLGTASVWESVPSYALVSTYTDVPVKDRLVTSTVVTLFHIIFVGYPIDHCGIWQPVASWSDTCVIVFL